MNEDEVKATLERAKANRIARFNRRQAAIKAVCNAWGFQPVEETDRAYWDFSKQISEARRTL